jgi:hypothetical protein
MAVWEVRVVAGFGDREWENVYHIDAGADSDVDPSVILELINFHVSRTFAVYVIKRLARRVLGTSDAFIEVAINTPGAIAPLTEVPAPLFNTIRMILQGGIGRVGSKFLRGMLVQSQVIDDNGTLAASLLTAMNSAFDSVLNAASTAGQTFVFGATDKPVVSAEFQGNVQERQRHRKRKRTA